MPHKITSQPDVPAGFVLGADIDITSWHGGELAIDLAGNVACYVGYQSAEQPFDLPYYSLCVALKHKGGRNSHSFVELRRGVLRKTGFLRSNEPYRVLTDKWLVLPRGTDCSFGVVSSATREEEAELTRQVFGGSQEDIESVAIALSKVIGRGFHEMVQLPRVTFSKTRNNGCDLSGCLIPKNFPYVAFDQSQYAWSHVSLHGFYRLLSFLCPNGGRSAVQQAMLDSGLAKSALETLLKSSSEQYGEPLPLPPYRE